MIRFALLLLISLGLSSQAIAAVKWNNSKSNSQTDLSEFSVQPFKAKMGKPNVSQNSVEGCGKPKNTYIFQFKGSKESAICQIGNSQEYKTGDTPISWPEYNFFGISKTKCADAITERPIDLYVTPASDKVGWCPYSNPEVDRFPLRKDNGFVKLLVANAEGAGIRVTDAMINSIDKNISFRKGFTAIFPPEAKSYKREENKAQREILQKNATIISAYLSGDEKQKNEIAERALNVLKHFESNDAFEYLFYAPMTLNVTKNQDGTYKQFADYSEPEGYDPPILALSQLLYGIVNLYGITKLHYEDHDLLQIKSYISKLLWLTEQGIVGLHYLPGTTAPPDQPNHHTAPMATLWLLWGITASDKFYYEAGLNHYFSILQMSRKDGSIASELKFNPRPKSPHGGWGSLRRNNETLSHQVMAAILLKSQGYNIEEINVSDVSIKELVEFAINSSADNSIADKYSGSTTYDLTHTEEPGSTLKDNLGWYKLAIKFLALEKDETFWKMAASQSSHDRIRDFGFLSINKIFFDEAEAPDANLQNKDGKLFIGVEPEKKSIWNF